MNTIRQNNQPNYIDFIKNRTSTQASEIYNQRVSDSLYIFELFSHEFLCRACPVCGSEEAESLEDFLNTYKVQKCTTCLTSFVNPCPTQEALAHYYNECKCNAMLGALLRSRHLAKNAILTERVQFLLDLIKKELVHKPRLRILEVGCNSGAFLSELKAALFAENLLARCELFGIDLDKAAIEKNVDPEIILEAISVEAYAEHSNEKYDVVVHFELIEHLPDPFLFMGSVGKLLNAGGIHHFHTPNANGFDNLALGYNQFRGLAHGIFPPMHLQAFTPQNIVHFSLRAGFKVVQIDTPGNFDVSMVRSFLSDDDQISPFKFIHEISEENLAIFQSWLKLLNASSHMRCTLRQNSRGR